MKTEVKFLSGKVRVYNGWEWANSSTDIEITPNLIKINHGRDGIGYVKTDGTPEANQELERYLNDMAEQSWEENSTEDFNILQFINFKEQSN